MSQARVDSTAFGPARRSAIPLAGVLTAAVLFALAPLPAAGGEIAAADTPTQVTAPATTAPTAPTLEITRGDDAWARRAEGQSAGRAAAAPIAAAVAAYEAALRAAPESLEAHWKLLRALWFQGDYATEGNEARKEVFARGRSVGDSAMAILAKGTGGKEKLAKTAAAAAALRAVPEAGPIYFWSAVHWGLWGDAFGKLAAARQGVAGRIRDYCEVVIALDEQLEFAGGHRVLGRLHTEAPSIPFITGWIDRDTAVSELRRAVELAPDYLYNRIYLAEALLKRGGASRDEARRLLADLVQRTPNPALLTEETRIVGEAKALLADL